VALRVDDLPPELRDRAGTLGRTNADVEPLLAAVLRELDRALALAPPAALEAFAARDELRGRQVSWGNGLHGRAVGIDDDGRLVVELPAGGRAELNAG